MGGMDLRHIHTLHGTRRIQYLIGHITNNDDVAKLMRIYIYGTQLEVGTFKPFFFLPFSLHGPSLVSRSWINEIWSLTNYSLGPSPSQTRGFHIHNEYTTNPSCH
jgi:hypothetical protein